MIGLQELRHLAVSYDLQLAEITADQPDGESYGADAETSKTRVISLEGNIGAGKSTLMQHLKEKFAHDGSVVFVDEPVAEWTQHGFLDRVYTETAVKLPFQLMVLTSLTCDLHNALARKPAPRTVITERSSLGNYHVFAKANLDDAVLKMFEFTLNRLMSTFRCELPVSSCDHQHTGNAYTRKG